MFDVPTDWGAGSQATFNRSKVYQGMEGTGITRIDTILANRPASESISSFELLWNIAGDYDHVPLRIGLDCQNATAMAH